MQTRTGGISRSILAAVLAIGVAVASPAASGSPTVTDVSGQIDQRSVITVTGSSFGAAPTVVVFDDFEGGTDGNNIMTGSGSAMYGQWAYLGGSPYYTDSWAVSGSLSFQADMSISWVQYVAATLPANTRDFFICWWMAIPAGDRIPGEGTHDTTNWKTIWVQGANTTDDDINLADILGHQQGDGRQRQPVREMDEYRFPEGRVEACVGLDEGRLQQRRPVPLLGTR